MSDSIFTRIIRGEIPSDKIYEDEFTYAFLDLHPVQPGHTLVIPKKEVQFLWDLDEDIYLKLMSTVKKVGNRIKTVLSPPYVGIKVEGIEVPHAHVHIIPFSTASEFRRTVDKSLEPDLGSLKEMAEKLRFN